MTFFNHVNNKKKNKESYMQGHQDSRIGKGGYIYLQVSANLILQLQVHRCPKTLDNVYSCAGSTLQFVSLTPRRRRTFNTDFSREIWFGALKIGGFSEVLWVEPALNAYIGWLPSVQFALLVCGPVPFFFRIVKMEADVSPHRAPLKL